MANKENNKKDNSELKWFITVFITTFILSIVFSYICTNAISSLELFPALLILILTIFIGIIFDIIGVAVTVAKEEELHAKASKKMKGAKTSIKLIRNSSRYMCRRNRRYMWSNKWVYSSTYYNKNNRKI